MFDAIITKCVQPKKVEWVKPDTMILDLGDEKGPEVYELLKGAETYVHKQIDVKSSTSKELFKKQESIWKQFKDLQLAKCKDNPDERLQFSLDRNTVVYLINEAHQIVDIVDLQTIEKVEEFKDNHKKFILDITTMERTKKFFTDGAGGVTKFVCYATDVDIAEEDYVSVVVLELNTIKSSYKVYGGIFMYKSFTLIPALSCDYDEDFLSSFISVFDLEAMLFRSNEKAQDIYNNYKEFKQNATEVSVRELTTLLKKVGYKLEFDTTDKLVPIEKISDEENNQKICNFYNTFEFKTGESAFEIVHKLSELKKAFRYNKITILDVLSILSKEYLTYDGSKITADILGSIMYKLYDNVNTDKIQTKSIEDSIDK